MNSFDFILSVAPLILLIVFMTKKKSMPANQALPLVAVVMYALKIFYFSASPVEVHAAVLSGALATLTPVTIIFGAVLLFKTMENIQSTHYLTAWLNQITSNKVGQLMIIGWSFSFLIEGISGFGTPAAIAAPLLMSLGFSAVAVAAFCLILNSVPVSFGAVGMPTWFGLGSIGLSPEQIVLIGFKSALIHTVAALIIPLIALRLLVSWSVIFKNIIYIQAVVLSTTLPYLYFARFNSEFPSIIGGTFGLVAAIVLAKNHIGLVKEKETGVNISEHLTSGQMFKAFFPILGTVGVLLVSRLPFLGIKEYLLSTASFINIKLGFLGDMSISPSFVIQLKNIFATDIYWKHATLYIPSLIPFVMVSAVCFLLFKPARGVCTKTWCNSFEQLKNPCIALIGAMIFVKLFMLGGEQSSASIVGESLARVSGKGWQFVSAYLGALGSFFSGSATVSNLTFSGIQHAIALKTGLDVTTILSLQSVGGAMGNMVCIHNILAVCAILSLTAQESTILKKTFLPMFVYGLIAVIVSLFF